MTQEIQIAKRFGEGAKIALYGRIVKVTTNKQWCVFSIATPEQFYIVKRRRQLHLP